VTATSQTQRRAREEPVKLAASSASGFGCGAQALEFDPVGIVYDAIEDGIGESRFTDEELAGNQRRATAMAILVRNKLPAFTFATRVDRA
jgi:hypothetical protein